MDTNGVSINEALQAHELIWNVSLSCIKPMSLKCAVELGIPDIINNNNDQPITLSKLISQLPIDPSKAQFIPRLMRILVHFGFFTSQKLDHEDENRYSLTPLSRILLKESPIRASAVLLSQLDSRLIAPWHNVTAWLKDGGDATPFEMTNGVKFWDCLGREPKFGNVFAESMAMDSRVVAKIVLDRGRHVFEGLESIVDVGGGTGIMAKAIAEAFPETKCTVLDLPYLVGGNNSNEIITNLKFVGGDMFEAIAPANAVLLKWVLHDWSDEETLIILKQCREAVGRYKDKGGKLIIIDMVINEESTENVHVYFDMLMMINLTGKERNRKEWETLFYKSGFSHWKISPIVGLRSLIEVYP